MLATIHETKEFDRVRHSKTMPIRKSDKKLSKPRKNATTVAHGTNQGNA